MPSAPLPTRRRTRRRTRSAGAVLAAGVVLALAGCGTSHSAAHHVAVATGSTSQGDLLITGAYIPQPASPSVAAAYFTVTDSGAADTLLSVTSPASTDVGLHRTVDHGSVGEMVPVGSLVVPAGGSLRMAPGGYHVMLMDPATMILGSRVELTLQFAKAGPVTVWVPVVPLTGTNDDSMSMSMSTSMSGSMTGMQ